MNKKILSIAILCLSTNTLFAAPVQVISDKNGIVITTSDADNLLKPAPVPDQLGLLNKKERFTEKLEQLYLTKAIAEQGKQQALSAEEQQELDNMTAMFYFQRKIKQLSTDNLPDFEPLAKIQFDAKKADYVNPERVAVEHILIDTKKHSEKAALKLANDLTAQLKKGADFAQLAEKYSEDPSVKTNKGKLGLFGKGQMIKEFEDAAYAIKLNEISKPVKTAFGYHVLRKYEHKAAGPKAFAEVKDELVGKIKKEYIQSR
ncbi:MAG: peptidylprolyl isomerase, partial [Methylococcales bacterium]|nr:peptidylprolyl isomerase [Methylococcales bacterium]